MKRETQSGAVSDLAKRPRRRGLQRGWGGLPVYAWLPSFPLHPHQSALQWTEAGTEEREMVRGPTVSSCQAGARALTPDTCRSLSHHRPNANQAWKRQGVCTHGHVYRFISFSWLLCEQEVSLLLARGHGGRQTQASVQILPLPTPPLLCDPEQVSCLSEPQLARLESQPTHM